MRHCEFFLLRYAPDAVKNEFVNIGVVLTSGAEFAEVRFTRDWERVQCMDPEADIEALAALEREMRAQLRGAESREALMKRVKDSYSNIVQMTEAKACLAQSPEQEIEKLAKMYLESKRRAPMTRPTGPRRAIAGAMAKAFEDAGVLERMRRDVRVAEHVPGDPLRIDFAYQPNGVVKFMHAVSLKRSVDEAKVLAFSFGMLRERLKSEMTAVVDEEPPKWFGEEGIEVVGVDRVGELAERVRAELG